MELVHSQVKNIANSLLKKWGIPSNYFFILEDSDENLKIQDVKKFTELSHSKPPYDFQIFLIENIRRLTLTSSNSLLKFLEEPGKQNIIFLTNTGENGILDTILSRVQIIPLGGNQISKKDAFYTELIDHSLK
jgi:DNA polymerase-3 subunit delta'